MAEFERGQETCDCQTANFFMCDMPGDLQDRIALRGLVNGQPTEIFPSGEIHRNPNTLEGTTATLALAANGMNQTAYYPTLEDGVPLDAGDLQMYVGGRDAGAADGVDLRCSPEIGH
ncbi:hypothetical protein [Jannaschia aquimarina]|uniref:Uncharacterized protein n=1 Tax=Jannaschia aquimarina TaxID=935700 RepID=A0A0D1D589_9RHOB|nr:hypothetical protein [Jannaschia aquimarina]KIT15173.1 hypothetical protein jaqu_31180 [Jannaschia aquimarina]SNT43301.1 hypothetical protein SAMN05421775_12213 [Jannaschia aquimarina]